MTSFLNGPIKDVTLDEVAEEALQMIANFKPKRPRRPMPLYPDLSVEGEKAMRRKPGGASFWHMPFRSKEFLDIYEKESEQR